MTEIPSFDRQSIYVACNLPSGSAFPKPLEVQYWRARRIMSRLGNCGPMPANVVVSVALLAGYGDEKPCDLVVETFVTLVQSGKVKKNQPIKVVWRNEELDATFLALRADGNVEFLLPTDKRTRFVTPDKARVLEAAA